MAKTPKTLPDDILRRPPPEAARLLALGFLEEAADNLKKLSGSDASEALHDFRVSIRRLRSTLRAYENELEGSVSKKVRKRLKDLWRSTSGGRDTEVQLAWIGEQRDRMEPDQMLGFDWMVRRLEAKKKKSYDEICREVAGMFSRIEANLLKKLSSYRMKVSREPIERGPVFCNAARGLIGDHRADLEERLEAVEDTRDREEAHQARISVKRLRYVLEPLAECLENGEELIGELKKLQDILGELQDMHVLGIEIGSALEDAAAEKARRLHDLALREDSSSEKLRKELEQDERTGILELARLLRGRQEDLYRKLDAEWLSGKAWRLLETIEKSSRGLTGDEADNVEIERKFLLRGLPPRAREHAALEIEQGWVRTEGMEERLRRIRSDDGDRFLRTFKLGSGIQRTQIEDEIPAELFEALWPFTRDRRLSKRRYRVEEDGLVWEIDEFLSRELCLAEVELESPDATVELPPWLEPYVEKEVTGDSRYTNAELARGATSSPEDGAAREEQEPGVETHEDQIRA